MRNFSRLPYGGMSPASSDHESSSQSDSDFEELENQPPRRTGELPEEIWNSQSLRNARAAFDPTLATKLKALKSWWGSSLYFMTNLYVFFLAICKDLDFMSWTTMIKRGLATGDQAVFMMLVYSVVGFVVGFSYFMMKACQNHSKINETEEPYQKAMQSSLEISTGLEEDPEGVQKQKNESAIQKYALTYGKPGDGDVFTVVRFWHCIPMLGVLSFIIFYTRENHDGRVSRLLRASSLRTLILINSWSTIAITIPCVFVIVYVFAFGGVTFKEADMFTKFSAFQAILSILLTFSAMGISGFEDTVVDTLKNADELSYQRVKSKVVCKMLYTYWSDWHLDLADLLMCFRIADIGAKKPLEIQRNGGRKKHMVISFPTEDDHLMNHSVWQERCDVVWKEGLITKCNKLITKYKQKGNIYQEHIISANCQAIVERYTAGEDNEFWKEVRALYAKVCAYSVEAAREVAINKAVLGLKEDLLESNLSEKFKEFELNCKYTTPLNNLNPDRTNSLNEYYNCEECFPPPN